MDRIFVFRAFFSVIFSGMLDFLYGSYGLRVGFGGMLLQCFDANGHAHGMYRMRLNDGVYRMHRMRLKDAMNFARHDGMSAWRSGTLLREGLLVLVHGWRGGSILAYFSCRREGLPSQSQRFPSIFFWQSQASSLRHRACASQHPANVPL